MKQLRQVYEISIFGMSFVFLPSNSVVNLLTIFFEFLGWGPDVSTP